MPEDVGHSKAYLRGVAYCPNRPLTYLCEDGGEPLTSSHLIIGRRLLYLLPNLPVDVTVQPEDVGNVSRRESYIRTVLSHYWKRWTREYLTDLREHHHPRQTGGPAISVGDVVCAQDEKKATRLNWDLAKVERLLTGRDGKVRAAAIQVNTNSGKKRELRQHIQKLFPVELRSEKQYRPASQPEVLHNVCGTCRRGDISSNWTF